MRSAICSALVLAILLAVPAGAQEKAAKDPAARLRGWYAIVAGEAQLDVTQRGAYEKLVEEWSREYAAVRAAFESLKTRHEKARAENDGETMKTLDVRREALDARKKKGKHKFDTAVSKLLRPEQKRRLAAFHLYFRVRHALRGVAITDAQKKEVRRRAAGPAKALMKLGPGDRAAKKKLADAFRKEIVTEVLTDAQREALKKLQAGIEP